MKILYVCTTTDLGGAEIALRRLVLAARQAGHTVKVISLKPLGVIAQELLKEEVEVSSLDVRGKCNPVQFAGALARIIREIQTFSPDVVHAFLYRAIQLCRLAKRRVNFHLITTPHYDMSKRNFLLRLWDRGLKNEDDISCAESATTERFLKEKQKYQTEKMRLICNGVDSKEFSPNAYEKSAVRSRLGIEPDEIVFVCVARLSKNKNHANLLESFATVTAKNPKIRLLVVGEGPENANLGDFAQKRGLTQKIIFVGQVSDVRPYLWASDVFVLPSLEESLPLSLLEAGACGLPSIVSKIGDMPQVVVHGQTGFVCNPKDPLIISVLMAELIENKKLRETMGMQARKRMEEKYPSPEPFYLKLYNQF